jgi:hypothetical protein
MMPTAGERVGSLFLAELPERFPGRGHSGIQGEGFGVVLDRRFRVAGRQARFA